MAGIVLLGVALFIGLSVASLQLGSGKLMGPFGQAIGLGMYALLGVGGYLFAYGTGLAAVRCIGGQPVTWRSVEMIAASALTVFTSILLHLGLGRYRLHGHGPGGVIGEYGAEFLVSIVGLAGAALVGTVGLTVSIVLATPLSMKTVLYLVSSGARAVGRVVAATALAVFPDRKEREQDDKERAQADKERERAEREREQQDARARKESERQSARALRADKKGRRDEDTEAEAVVDLGDDDPALHEHEQDRERGLGLLAAAVEAAAAERQSLREAAGRKRGKKSDDAAQLIKLDEEAPVVAGSAEIIPPLVLGEALAAGAAAAVTPVAAVAAPKIVEPATPKKKAAPEKIKEPKPDYIPAEGGYHLPEINLLDYEERAGSDLDKNAMLTLAEKLEQALAHFQVKGKVVQIHPGPVITMYEFVPVPGTKLSKITTLSNDLAMALEAVSIRIVAPIPGKGSVGFEVPNKSRATVFLKEILGDDNVHKMRSRLTMGLGKDIAGIPCAVDLAKMPHLLVAGTTGSGKSVAVNGMICSILFNATPEEVRMIMIDPKMLELSIYEGIPHLLLPVVTDPKKANLALRWAVDEMERRYELLSKSGTRDIAGYNKKVEKILADGPPAVEETKIKIYVTDENGEKQEVEVSADEDAVKEAGGTVTAEVREEISQARALTKEPEPLPRKLPYIVVIIDEFADLMMVASKDVETSVARIAQKARAAGIHLILATQRPSVDVITGLIKANFPSRIAFQVASRIDSRTILDQQGAEHLLGQGDMLFTDRGAALRRIHGALVTETEIKRLVDHLKEQGQPVYDLEILKPRAEEDGEGLEGEGDKDEMYDMAVKIVCETRQASVSMIQRRLQVGYNRAARMVEQMERDGIVGAANGAKPREVLAQAV